MISAIMLGVFLFTVLLTQHIITLLGSRKALVNERLQTTLSQDTNPVNLTGKAWGISHRLRGLISKSTLFIGRRYLDRLQISLNKAGLPLKAEEVVIISCLCGLLSFGVSYLWVRFLPILLIFGTIGIILPIITIKFVQKRRIIQLEGQLLNALVLLANSLRAGHSFLQAIELVSRETPQPLAAEFARMLQENKVGIPMEEALGNLKNRIDSKDLDLIVTGVLIQRQVGGNLAEVIDSISQTIDKRIKNKAKIRVLTAQGRASAWIISLLPFVLAVVVFGKNPNFGRIMLEEFIGQIMLAGGLILLIIGILVVRKVVSIDV